MKGQTHIDRLIIFGRRKLNAVINGLRPTAIKGRLTGPRVFMNSIPKSGTNLLESALNNFPLVHNVGRRTLLDWDIIREQTLNSVKNIHKGQIIIAHLPAHASLLHLLKSENIKSLCMIRDPRDIVVSSFKYVTNIDLTHVSHRYFASLKDDDARLLASINGVKGLHASIGNILEKYEGWLNDKNTLVVRFEDLIGNRGGGDDAIQYETIMAIARHLGIYLTEAQAHEICEKTFSTKSPTFRAGLIGGWKKYFKDIHVKAFENNVKELLLKYGYKY